MQFYCSLNEIFQKGRMLRQRRNEVSLDGAGNRAYANAMVDLIHELTDQQISKAHIRTRIGLVPLADDGPKDREFVEDESAKEPPLGGVDFDLPSNLVSSGIRIFGETMQRPEVVAARAWVRQTIENARAPH